MPYYLKLYTEYNGYCTGDKKKNKNLIKLIDDGVKYAKEAGIRCTLSPIFIVEIGQL